MFKPHHIAISCKNLNQSINFYEAFGFKKVRHWQLQNGMKIIHMHLCGFDIELFETGQNYKNISAGIPHFAFSVPSMNDAVIAIKTKLGLDNIKIIEGQTGLKFFNLIDPSGINIEIVEENKALLENNITTT